MFSKNNKTILTLRQFSRQEWLAWVVFCKKESKHTALLQLVGLLQMCYPIFDISKEYIHTKLFPNQTYNDLKIRQLFHRLQKITEDFLVYQHALSIPEKSLVLASHFKQKKISKQQQFFQLKLKKETAAISDIQHFKTVYYLETEKMDALEAKQDRTVEPNLQNVHNTLDRLYLAEKLKLACSAINYSRINKYQYDLGFIDDLETKIEAYVLPEDTVLYALYQTYLFTRYDHEQNFNILQSLLQSVDFQKSDMSNIIFTMSINFCIRRINALKTEYFPKLFTVYKAQLKSGCSYDGNGFISPITLRNVLTVSLRLQDYKWSEELIKSHYERLPVLHRDENYNALLARLYYVKKEYTKAMRLLAQSEPVDFLNNISARVLLLKCYYETDDYNALDNSLENFRIYLLRHKNKGYHYIFHTNFIKYLKRIVKASVLPKGKKALFLEKLTNEKQIAEKAWLLQIAH